MKNIYLLTGFILGIYLKQIKVEDGPAMEIITIAVYIFLIAAFLFLAAAFLNMAKALIKLFRKIDRKSK